MGIARVLVPLGTAAAIACREPSAPVPPAAPIGAVIDEHPQPFTGPIRLVELRDGRVVAYDARESRLVRVDFAAHAEEPLAGRGDGPLEYKAGFKLVPAAGDSVWMFDLMKGRILVLAPDGAPVRSFAVTDADDSQARVNAPWLEGIAPDGGWVGRSRSYVVRSENGLPRAGFADSISVVRVAAAGGHDTVANLATFRGLQASTGGTRSVIGSFDTRDGFGVFSAGRVLIVRGATYSPELHDPDGSVRSAEPVVHQRVALTDADVRMVMDSVRRMTSASMASVLAQMPGSGGAAAPSVEYVAPDPKPAFWPLLEHESIPVDRQDRAWVPVRDSSTATLGQRYDLLDRDGRFLQAVRVPLGAVLAGFGRTTLYIARRDDDDLLWLGRYPLPD
jgi:hypothetical protein